MFTGLADQIYTQYIIHNCLKEFAVDSNQVTNDVGLFPVAGQFSYFLLDSEELHDHCLGVGVDGDMGHTAQMDVGVVGVVVAHNH